MEDVAGILAGGGIAVVASLLTTWLAHRLQTANRRLDSLGQINRLLGRRASLQLDADEEISVDGVMAAYERQWKALSSESKKNPELIDFTLGYTEHATERMEYYIREAERLQEENRRLEAQIQRLTQDSARGTISRGDTQDPTEQASNIDDEV